MVLVLVLDLDETLGFYDGQVFQIRPKLKFFLDFVRVLRMDLILWSMGTDDYVEMVVNSFLPEITQYAYKIFGRTECEASCRKYRYNKCSEHVKLIYNHDILLLAVDDRVNENMDSQYDLRIHIEPYQSVNLQDRKLVDVVEKLTEFCLEHAHSL